MKKFLFLMLTVLFFLISANPSHGIAIPLEYMNDKIIAQSDLKQLPGAEKLLEDYWGHDILHIGEVSHSATLDGQGNEIASGTWWTNPSQDLLGISWKADGYWQVFALDPNESSGIWNLLDLWEKSGFTPELSNVHGYALVSIPDASVMFLLGSALIGLGMFGRRRKTSNF